MKLKDDILEKFEKGVTIFEIAEEYNTDINAVLELLDLTRLDRHLDPTDDAKVQQHLKQYGLSREDFVE